MKPISKRKKNVPKVTGMPMGVRDISDENQRETFRRLDLGNKVRKPDESLEFVWVAKYGQPSPIELRKMELSKLHGIPESDIFIDRGNGVELYKTSYGTWATSPGY